MKGKKVLFSSESDEWETPQNLFDELNKEFNFVFDLAAKSNNAKCSNYTDSIERIENDFELIKERSIGEDFIWCNPPYSNVRKFLQFQRDHNLNAVFLIYARTDTRWFHEYVYNKSNVEIRFIKGRFKI